ncbi:MAG: DUF4440 domain-containing protein [Saprospiraceae bacterium]|nr:DUF4440 domain-containing protein [Saprospiraceae bacterium]
MKSIFISIILITFVTYGFFGCTEGDQKEVMNVSFLEDEAMIRSLLNEYVEGWKAMDEARIMDLFEDNAMIQPNRLTPIQGKESMKDFWFPRDGSITIINKFDTEEISLNFRDSLAIMTYESYIDWNYQKDTTQFGMIQTGIVTNIYRKQKDDSWKVWRSMWSDILFTPK